MKKLYEPIVHNKIYYAEVIRSNLKTEQSTFFSPEKSSFQFGILAHKKGYQEPFHYHKSIKRVINDLQQMFVVQKGKVRVDIYTKKKKFIRSVVLKKGDAINLIHGIHAIKALENMQCISVKQGPFFGPEFDQVFVKVNKN